jgi:hypothetical protein
MARRADPGKHPRVGTPAFEEVWRNRRFREVAPNEEARKQKVLEKQKRWRLKKKQKDRAAELDVGLDSGLDAGLDVLDELDMLDMLDLELGVEPQKPQAIGSQILARIDYAFERLRYVTFQAFTHTTMERSSPSACRAPCGMDVRCITLC